MLREELLKIFTLLPSNVSDKNFLFNLTVYILAVSNLKDADIKESFNQLPPHVKDEIMSTYDRIIAKGRVEGEVKSKTETVLRCFDNGLSIPMIANIVCLPDSDIISILKKNNKLT